MTASRQLALPFSFTVHYDPGGFLPDASNAAARRWLEVAWPERRLALWGGAGCGKTHLLHVWTARTGAALLPGPGLRGAAVQGLLQTLAPGGLAIDDADHAPEQPLLHVLNAAAEAGCPVLLAAREAPARWTTALPDLTSRLRAAAAVELGAPSEALLRALLARLLADRQMAVPEALQQALLLGLPRHPAALREAAARLDRITMAAGGKVTRAVVEAVIAAVEAED